MGRFAARVLMGLGLASRMVAGVRRVLVGVVIVLLPWPDKRDIPAWRWRLVKKAIDLGVFDRGHLKRLWWLLCEPGSPYAEDPALAPGLIRAAALQKMHLPVDDGEYILSQLLRAGSLDLASFQTWFETDSFWGTSRTGTRTHVCELLPSLAHHVPPLELPDWLDVMGRRFPGEWCPMSVTVGRAGTRAFVDLLLAVGRRLPRDTQVLRALEAGDRLGGWLKTHFRERNQLVYNPMVRVLLSTPRQPTLLLRAWCSGVARVFFEDAGEREAPVQLVPGGPLMRQVCFMVEVTAKTVRKAPWLAPLKGGKHPLRPLLEHHPFWSACLPERVEREILEAGLSKGSPPVRSRL